MRHPRAVDDWEGGLLRTGLADFLRSTSSPAPPVETTALPRVRFTVRGMMAAVVAVAFLRVRFTVRGMMIAVAAVALVLGGIQSWQLHLVARDFRDQAAIYSWKAIQCEREERRERSNAEGWQKGEDEFQRKTGALLPSPSYHHVLTSLWQADRDARAAVYYDRMKAKYERAAAHPWLPVEPDPLPPG
jgi:hypothetical protein